MKLSLPSRSKGRPRRNAPEIRRTIISGDWHIPEVDIPTYRAFLNFMRHKRPDYHIINGDFIDAYELSKFDKDPARLGQTAEELGMAKRILDELAEASPNTITKFLYGNHSDRIRQRILEHPELLPFMTKSKDPNSVLAEALSLKERGIEWFSYPDVYSHFGFDIQHGGKGLGGGGQNPSKSAAEKAGGPGVQGHWHRERVWQVVNRRTDYKFYTLGVMCRLNPTYLPFNDWSHSFGYLEQQVGADRHVFHSIQVEKGEFMFDGYFYNQDGVFESKQKDYKTRTNQGDI